LLHIAGSRTTRQKVIISNAFQVSISDFGPRDTSNRPSPMVYSLVSYRYARAQIDELINERGRARSEKENA
jgi:hypothetical protein